MFSVSLFDRIIMDDIPALARDDRTRKHIIHPGKIFFFPLLRALLDSKVFAAESHSRESFTPGHGHGEEKSVYDAT